MPGFFTYLKYSCGESTPFKSVLSVKWRWTDLNRRPSACKADALPTELHPLRVNTLAGLRLFGKVFKPHRSTEKPNLVGVPELESGTSSLSATRSNQLSYTPVSTAFSWLPLDDCRARRLSEAAKCTETRLSVKGKNRLDFSSF